MQAIILKCPRGARFHFGNVAMDENTSLDDTAIYPHSDTLFSAIISTAFLLAPEKAPELIEAFSAGKVKHSSAFFCLEAKHKEEVKWIFFLPKPVHANFIKSSEEAEKIDFKQLRKLRFLSKAVWEAGYTAQQWFDLDHCALLPGGFVVTKDEAAFLPLPIMDGRKKKIYQKNTYPKVRVHDLDKKEGYFHQASVQLGQFFSKAEEKWTKTHYYFLLEETLEAELQSLLHATLAVLVDHGIGGERTVGCGRLEEIEKQHFQWNIPATDWGVNLSLVNPGNEIDSCSYYKTVIRGGRRIKGFGQNTYLQKTRMLLEGGLLKRTVAGHIVPIGPKEGKDRFLRSGIHFNAPLHEKILAHVK